MAERQTKKLIALESLGPPGNPKVRALVEKVRNPDPKNPLEVGELRFLSQKDENGEYFILKELSKEDTRLAWIFINKKPLAQYGTELEEKLKRIEEVLYFKRLEGALLPEVRRNIASVARQTRGALSSVLEGSVDLDGQVNLILESTESEIILGKRGGRVIEAAGMDEYLRRIRSAVHEQAINIEKLSPDPGNQLFEIYDRANYLVRFFSEHIQEKSKKDFLLAYLTKQIREAGEDYSKIHEFYVRLSGAVKEGKSFDDMRTEIDAYVRLLAAHAMKAREKHFHDTIRERGLLVGFQDEELKDYFKSGQTLDGVSTYEGKAAAHLQTIENALISIEMGKITKDAEMKGVYDEAKYNSIILDELGEIRDEIKEYKSRNFDRLIEELPGELADTLQKTKLRKAIQFVIRFCGEDAPAIAREISKLKNPEEVNAYVQKKEEKVEDFVIRRSSSTAIARKTLERLKKNDTSFDVYAYAHDQTDFKNAMQDEEQMEKYLHGEELKTIQAHLHNMGVLLGRNFIGPNDGNKFEEHEQEIEKMIKGSFYSTTVPLLDERGKYVRGPNGDIVPHFVQVQRKMPPEEQKKWDSLSKQKKNVQRFGKSLSLVPNLDDIDFQTPGGQKKVKDALEALYSEVETFKAPKHEIEKMSSVMSIGHELTMIRFHPRDKVPFEYKGQYQFLDVEGKPFSFSGKPATFLQRSQELLLRAKTALMNGNFVELQALFSGGMIADRLFKDALFFPVKTLRNPGEFLVDKDKDIEGKTTFIRPSKKISEQFHDQYFKKYIQAKGESPDKIEQELEQQGQKYRDHDVLKRISSLDEDKEFCTAIGLNRTARETTIVEFVDQYHFQPDGTIVDPEGKPVTNEKMEAELKSLRELVKKDDITLAAHGGGKAAKAFDVSKERIEMLKKDYPLVAARVAQFNNEFLGWTAGGIETVARMGMNDIRALPSATKEFLGGYIRSINWLSPMHIWIGIWQIIEHVEKMVDEKTKYTTYLWLEHTFEGTILGSEFKKLAESQEHHRVDEFKQAMHHYGHDAVIDKLYHARDIFEFKAALSEGFEERGIITLEDLLKKDFIKALNAFHLKGYKIPDSKYTDEEMQEVRKSKLEMLRHIEESLDLMWGKGTFQKWKSAGESKFESKKKESSDAMSTYTGAEKKDIYNDWFKQLRTHDGIAELKRKHPGEYVGMIEQDMLEGKQDSGVTFGIMQAMICAGVIRLQHVIHLQYKHANDLPIHALLEPKQAELCGLKAFFNECMAEGEELNGGKKWHDFHQGIRAIRVRGRVDNGKWKFAKSKEDFVQWRDKDKTLQSAYVTIHQFQQTRQTQEKDYKTMDNSSIGIFIPSYNFPEVMKAYHCNTAGNIEARPHDVVAGYRGFHHVFAAHMEVLGNTEKFPTLGDDPEENKRNFLRSVWHAYHALAKTCGFAMLLNRYKGKDKNGMGDFKHNSFDPSPKFGDLNDHDFRGDGKSKFEELILTNQGDAQRMLESQAQFDKINLDKDGNEIENRVMTAKLRTEFKRMAGFQFMSGGGINDRDGKQGGKPDVFDMNKYDPQRAFVKTIDAFMENVRLLARRRNLEAQVMGSLTESGMDNFGNRNWYESWPKDNERDMKELLRRMGEANEIRQKKMKDWYSDVIKI